MEYVTITTLENGAIINVAKWDNIDDAHDAASGQANAIANNTAQYADRIMAGYWNVIDRNDNVLYRVATFPIDAFPKLSV